MGDFVTFCVAICAGRDDWQGADERQAAATPGGTQTVGADGCFPVRSYGSPALALPHVEVCALRTAGLCNFFLLLPPFISSVRRLSETISTPGIRSRLCHPVNNSMQAIEGVEETHEELKNTPQERSAPGTQSVCRPPCNIGRTTRPLSLDPRQP